MYCGSKRRANSTISASLTEISPYSKTAPGTKSSKWRSTTGTEKSVVLNGTSGLTRPSWIALHQPHKKVVDAPEREGDELRLHHRRRRVSRFGHGQPAVGQKQQQGAALRSRSGYAARQGAAGDPRQLSGYGLFRPALSLDRAQGPHRGHLAQPPGGRPPAVAQIRAGAGVGR